MFSRFHSAITVFLAVALGGAMTIALMPQSAVGYPTAAISYGQNPVTSSGGSVGLDGTTTSTSFVVAPGDADTIVTDVSFSIFSSGYTCGAEAWEASVVVDGETIGNWSVWAPHEQNKYTGYVYTQNFSEGRQLSMRSGMRIPAGSTANLVLTPLVTPGGCDWRTVSMKWMWSGYHAAQ